VTTVAVIAHREKQLGDGLPELRRALAAEGVIDPLWWEVTKSKQARRYAAQAVDEGVDLVFAWGGDGMVQRCADALAGSKTTLCIVPAGTANLLATDLGIPKEVRGAVRTGLAGDRRILDLGVLNGERFAVMAGMGLDAMMIRDAGGSVKGRLGRVGYVYAGAKNLGAAPMHVRIHVDEEPWFKGKVGCVLFGNIGTILGGITVFKDARPDDGRLSLGILTAKGLSQWLSVAGRTAIGQAERSPFVTTTQGRAFDVRIDGKAPYELDGGDRTPKKRFRVKVDPGAISIAVPAEALA
jgi:YegS/Rv2252/BmrU family lipid kinase